MIPIRDNLPRRNLPIVTWLVILANAIVFYFEASFSEARLASVVDTYGVVPKRVLDRETGVLAFAPGAWLPFLTSMFLHGGLLHLIGNMWTLWIFGDNIEDRMGSGRYLLFYVLCGIVAGFVHTLTNAGSEVPAIGASGAIAGAMGAYFLMFPGARIVAMFPVFFYPVFFEIPAFFYLLWWIVCQLGSGTTSLGMAEASGGVAWWAHIGGFAAGALLFPFFLKPKRRTGGWPARR